MTARQIWYQVHKYVGLATLAFLIVAATTGMLLVFEKEADAALNADLYVVERGATRFDPAALAGRLEAAHPELRVVSMPSVVRSRESVLLTVAARVIAGRTAQPLGYDQVFMSPLDGSTLGTRATRPGLDQRHLLQGIYTLHVNLLAGTWGGRLMGAVGLLWLIESIVGFYLTLPGRRPFFAKWKSAWTVSWSGHWPRFLLRLHRASGLWVLILTLVFAYSSYAIGLYYEAFEPIVTAISPPARTPFEETAPPADGHAPGIGFAEALALAAARAGHDRLAWPAAKVSYVPERSMYGVMFSRSGREEYSGIGPITYYLDDRAGDLRFVDNPYADSTGAKVLRATYPIHSGEVGGTVTRWIVLGLGVVLLEMSLSGLVVWWSKRRLRQQGLAVAPRR